jgi:hypothetical protein
MTICYSYNMFRQVGMFRQVAASDTAEVVAAVLRCIGCVLWLLDVA